MFFAVSLCFSGSAIDTIPLPDISLWGRYTLGQVVSSATEQGFDYNFQGEWLENIDGGIRFKRQVSPHLLGRLNVGFTVNASTVHQQNTLSVEFTAKKFTAALLDAAIQYTNNDVFMKHDVFQLEFGFFPFKYDPQSTNLGEYIFRSNCYPALLVSGFENSVEGAKLGGLHLGYLCDALGKLKQDILVNSELDIYPLRDINVAYLATYTPHPVFTIGAGVEFARLIVFDPKKTTPGLDRNYHPALDQWVGYGIPGTADTTLYTFKGTKLMGRATLDIKAATELFTGKLDFFGKEDLKLYGEAAVLGVKDYPGWYQNRRDRIPVMAGLDLPTFKLLDVFSVELEYFKNPYWNSQEFIWKAQSPVPYIGTGSSAIWYSSWNDSMAKHDDDIKWSIYASKKIGTFLRISAQAASDHTPRNWYTPGPPSFVKYTDMVPRTKDWYYMIRASFYF
jgi:hypothetical protein